MGAAGVDGGKIEHAVGNDRAYAEQSRPRIAEYFLKVTLTRCGEPESTTGFDALVSKERMRNYSELSDYLRPMFCEMMGEMMLRENKRRAEQRMNDYVERGRIIDELGLTRARLAELWGLMERLEKRAAAA